MDRFCWLLIRRATYNESVRAASESRHFTHSIRPSQIDSNISNLLPEMSIACGSLCRICQWYGVIIWRVDGSCDDRQCAAIHLPSLVRFDELTS
jgi:hypothetical protein